MELLKSRVAHYSRKIGISKRNKLGTTKSGKIAKCVRYSCFYLEKYVLQTMFYAVLPAFTSYDEF